ncbi:MAG: hypothetical protein M1814_003603 [Vezdaea aestivalis]|nr:MAG: hypothetical protein M1814_003603 [Vezdaea aestivalis]
MIRKTGPARWVGKGEGSSNIYGLMANGLADSLQSLARYSTYEANLGGKRNDDKDLDQFWRHVLLEEKILTIEKDFADKASNVFITYVLYGKMKDTWDDDLDLSPSNCDSVCGESIKCYCDPNPQAGMA